MNPKTFVVLGILVAACPAVASACIPPPVPPPAPAPIAPQMPANTNTLMGPVAGNGLSTALALRTDAHALLDQAVGQGLDVSGISDSIAEADALLEKAQKMRANPIPANNLTREAIKIYNEAISELKELIG